MIAFKILGYLFLLIIIFTLPEKLWDKIYCYLKVTFSIVKKIFYKLTGGELVAQQIINQLSNFENELQFSDKRGGKEIPQYKFYTLLIEKILLYNRKYGAPMRKIIVDIRGGLIRDDQFERKLRKEFCGGIGQFLFISIITWFFVFMSQLITEVSITFDVFVIIGLMQITGIGLFYFFYSKWKKYTFLNFADYFYSLYAMRSLSEIGLSVRQVLHESIIAGLISKEVKIFKNINLRLKRAVDSWQKRGSPVQQELKEITDELWFIQDENFRSFIKKVGILKFFILATFFLSSYFVYLSYLFHFFLIE